MRIGFFSDSYFPEIDGVTYTLQLWKEKLEEKGHTVYIIYPDSEDYKPREREIPVRSAPNPFYQGYNIPIPVSIDVPDLDVVHCHTPTPLGWAGRYYSHKHDVPCVYTHHTPIEEYFIQGVKIGLIAELMKKMYVPIEEMFLKSFKKVITNTSQGKRDVEAVNLDAGIEMDFFRSSSLDWGLKHPIIGYSGRISNEKNIEKILEVSELVEGTTVIVGEGPAKEKLEEKAPENVVFKDFLDRENLPGYYSMLDVFVTASTGDTLGLSPLEANACGTPVVAPNVHPFDKTIKDGNGILYDLEDKHDFAEKIRTAANQKWNTRKHVKKYSMEESIDKMEKIYNQISG